MPYQICAYSPSLNELQQQISLENPLIEDARIAQQHADAFANLYNTNKKMQAEDWVGRAIYYQN